MEPDFVPTIGRIVHFQVAEAVWRPAIVVQDWDARDLDAAVNLVVFLDGANDWHYVNIGLPHGLVVKDAGSPVAWATSRLHGWEIGDWITPREYADRLAANVPPPA